MKDPRSQSVRRSAHNNDKSIRANVKKQLRRAKYDPYIEIYDPREGRSLANAQQHN